MSASGGLIPTTRLPPSVVNSSAATNGLVPVANGSGGYAWKTVAEIALAGPAGPVGMTWRGVYSGATTYATNDAVSYQGSAYIATEGTTGVAPKTTAPWSGRER